jgi:glycosyltransferase involved in cell wall biosynthesis
MEKISACIITYNEEAVIKECIESLSFADEIIVVDSHSIDKTREIAAFLGAKVVEHPFKSHIDQKNYALTLATNDWVISLDADERISDALKDEIEKTFSNGKLHDGYRFKRKTTYLNRWISHCGWYPDRHLRLFKRSKSKWAGKNPHDRIYCTGKVKNLKSDMTHYSFNSLSAHLKTIDNFSGIMARDLFKRGKTGFVFLKLIFKPMWKFIEMYILKRGFLDGREGFIISVYSAFSTFAKFSKLYEIKKMGFDGKYKD